MLLAGGGNAKFGGVVMAVRLGINGNIGGTGKTPPGRVGQPGGRIIVPLGYFGQTGGTGNAG